MNTRGRLRQLRTDTILLNNVVWCESFGGKLLGLMFRRSLPQDEGLLMVEKVPSRISTSIHMLFMNFPIAVIWLDKELHVLDMKLAKPWHFAYVPARSALCTLEANVDVFRRLEIGDQLAFEP